MSVCVNLASSIRGAVWWLVLAVLEVFPLWVVVAKALFAGSNRGQRLAAIVWDVFVLGAGVALWQWKVPLDVLDSIDIREDWYAVFAVWLVVAGIRRLWVRVMSAWKWACVSWVRVSEWQQARRKPKAGLGYSLVAVSSFVALAFVLLMALGGAVVLLEQAEAGWAAIALVGVVAVVALVVGVVSIGFALAILLESARQAKVWIAQRRCRHLGA